MMRKIIIGFIALVLFPEPILAFPHEKILWAGRWSAANETSIDQIVQKGDYLLIYPKIVNTGPTYPNVTFPAIGQILIDMPEVASVPGYTSHGISDVDAPERVVVQNGIKVADYDPNWGDGWIRDRERGWLFIRFYPWVWTTEHGWLYFIQDDQTYEWSVTYYVWRQLDQQWFWTDSNWKNELWAYGFSDGGWVRWK